MLGLRQVENQQQLLRGYSKNQMRVLKKLYRHYGEDFAAIKQEFQLLFPKVTGMKRNAYYLKQTIYSQILQKEPDVTKTEQIKALKKDFEKWELKLIYEKLIHYSRNSLFEIGNKWGMLADVLPGRFRHDIQYKVGRFFKDILRNLVEYLAPEENKYYYLLRYQRLQMYTIVKIFYFSQHQIEFHEMENELFLRLCWASQIFESWISQFIDLELYKIKDFRTLIDFYGQGKQLPIPSQQFIEVSEVILALDTITRIINEDIPYSVKEKQIKRVKHFKNKRKRIEILYRSQNDFYSDDQIKTKEQSDGRQKFQDSEFNEAITIYEKIFPKMNDKQLCLLQNSSIFHQLIVIQHSGLNEKKFSRQKTFAIP